MTHRNARLTPVTRAELPGEGRLASWPKTVAKWVRRIREGTGRAESSPDAKWRARGRLHRIGSSATSIAGRVRPH